MKLISQVLKDSQETRRQVIGALANSESGKVEDIHEYCALGALACEAGLFKSEIVEELGGSHIRLIEPTYTDILKAYEIKDQIDPIQCNDCDDDCCQCGDEYCDAQHEPKSYESLSEYIIHLNDDHGYTFQEIGGILEDMGL